MIHLIHGISFGKVPTVLLTLYIAALLYLAFLYQILCRFFSCEEGFRHTHAWSLFFYDYSSTSFGR